jgi:subtilase family serine protease
VLLDKPLSGDLLAPIVVSFKNANGGMLNFYTGSVIIPQGQTSFTATLPYTVPNNISGVCQFVLTIDPNNSVNESNENDNIAQTAVTIFTPTPPTQGLDVKVEATGYEWMDATRVRIFYKITNVGTAPITSWKAVVGFNGQWQSNWNRSESIFPGRSTTGATVWPASTQGQLPNTWKIRVTELNALPDSNPANNEASILVTR